MSQDDIARRQPDDVDKAFDDGSRETRGIGAGSRARGTGSAESYRPMSHDFELMQHRVELPAGALRAPSRRRWWPLVGLVLLVLIVYWVFR